MRHFKKLSDLCEINSGGTPSRSRIEYWEEGHIPWVKIKDIKSKYVLATEECITDLGLSSSSARLFSAGTILYSIFATIGEVAILGIEATTNQAIAGLSLRTDEISLDYLFYFLISIKGKVKSDSRGVAQNNINLTYLRNILVPIISLAEQEKICLELEKIDDLIELRQLQLTELDNLIKSRYCEEVVA